MTVKRGDPEITALPAARVRLQTVEVRQVLLMVDPVLLKIVRTGAAKVIVADV